MSTITEYAGRRIEERHGVAGAVSFTVVADSLHYFQLVGSEYGAPGPVTLIVGGMQSHVSAADRFGDRFDVEYVKRWIDAENGARSLVLAAPEPIDVVCPACNARPGKPCTAPTDTSRRPVGWMHASRTEAVRS